MMKRKSELSRVLGVPEISDEEGRPPLRPGVVRDDPRGSTLGVALKVELRKRQNAAATPKLVGWDARWRIEVHRSDVWARGIRSVFYQILDERTLTVIASAAVKGRSTATVLGLLASLTRERRASRFISTLDLELIQDERFQDWVCRRRIRVLFLASPQNMFAGSAE